MTRSEIQYLYFEWLCKVVDDSAKSRWRSYKKLLQKLYHTDFVYTHPMDLDREEDGVYLRYYFKLHDEHDISQAELCDALDNTPCSVLEMMVALARRIEMQIMYDDDCGDRTRLWFWAMINNIGLGDMTDSRYNDTRVERQVDYMMYRLYDKEGHGGLFTVTDHPNDDLRSIDIWYQAMWYLTELDRKNGELT